MARLSINLFFYYRKFNNSLHKHMNKTKLDFKINNSNCAHKLLPNSYVASEQIVSRKHFQRVNWDKFLNIFPSKVCVSLKINLKLSLIKECYFNIKYGFFKYY